MSSGRNSSFWDTISVQEALSNSSTVLETVSIRLSVDGRHGEQLRWTLQKAVGWERKKQSRKEDKVVDCLALIDMTVEMGRALGNTSWAAVIELYVAPNDSPPTVLGPAVNQHF